MSLPRAREHRGVVVVLVLTGLMIGLSRVAAQSNDQEFLLRVSQDLATLKSEYPQLAEFSSSKALDIAQLKIVYEFHTHRAERPGGWAAGVPNPDPDGLWFYIDLHDSSSRAQIHTQPVTAPICFGTSRLSFLILEGSTTRPLAPAIWQILRKYGAETCGNRAG